MLRLLQPEIETKHEGQNMIFLKSVMNELDIEALAASHYGYSTPLRPAHRLSKCHESFGPSSYLIREHSVIRSKKMDK